jgi:hypothetical protein
MFFFQWWKNFLWEGAERMCLTKTATTKHGEKMVARKPPFQRGRGRLLNIVVKLWKKRLQNIATQVVFIF